MATAISDSEIDLAWVDNSSTETGFKIERSPDNATWAQIGTAVANATTYNDTGLTDGTKYYYRVRAYNAGGNSAYSNTANAITTMLAPSGLAAVAMSDTEIDLTWTNNSASYTNVEVQRSPDNSTWATIATLGQVANYQNTGLTAATQYFYQVRATNSVANSAYSASSNATTNTTPPTPLDPRSKSGIAGFWDFTNAGTLWQDAGATVPVLVTSNPIVLAQDTLSGNANNAAQAVGYSPPLWSSDGLGTLSEPYALTSGSVLAMDIADAASIQFGTGDFSILVIYAANQIDYGGSDAGHLICKNGVAGFLPFLFGGSLYVYVDSVLIYLGATDMSLHDLIVSRASGVATAYLDGMVVGTQSASGDVSGPGINAALFHDSAAAAGFYNGKTGMSALYSVAFSDAEASGVHAWRLANFGA